MVLRRGTLDSRTLVDVARALGAAAVTIALFRWLPVLPPWMGIPLCLACFTAASLALGLLSGRDVRLLTAIARRSPASA